MNDETAKRYFSVLSNRNVGIEFPEPKRNEPLQVFSPGDPVIITTNCEDIALHELTGVVSSISPHTGSVIVTMDADGSKLPFRSHEIGHRY